MTLKEPTPPEAVLVAIDVSKNRNDVLIAESSDDPFHELCARIRPTPQFRGAGKLNINTWR